MTFSSSTTYRATAAIAGEHTRLAFRAVNLNDEVLRGTGLEYLENVLPSSLQEMLTPRLGKRPRVKPRPQRPRQEIVEELLTTMNIPLSKLRQ